MLRTGHIWCIKTRREDQTPAGFIWLGSLRGGMGGQLRRVGSDEEFSLSQNLVEEVTLRARKSDEELVDVEDRENWQGPGQLTLDQRAEGFHSIVTQLSLSDSHRQKLMQERFLTADGVEKLVRAGYRSIEHGQKFPGVQAPGFLADGQFLGKSGLLIPAQNSEGKIIGAQIAPDEVENGAKYLWLSKEDSPVALEDGCWPLFMNYRERRSEIVLLVDGALKSGLVALQYGYPTIGVPGARFTTSGLELSTALAQIFRDKKGDRMAVLMADAGDAVNAGGMPANLISSGRFLQEKGFTVRVGWWEQKTKASLDADERMVDGSGAGTEVSLKTLMQFADLVEGMTGRRPLSEGKSYQVGVNWHDPTKKPVELEVLSPQKDPFLFEPGERTEVLQSLMSQGKRHVAEISPTATGKSSYIAATRPSDHGAKVTIWVTRRAIDVASEFGLPYLRAKDNGRIFSEDGRLVRASENTDPKDIAIQANCSRGGALTRHLQKGMVQTASKICEGCPDRRTCMTTPGWAKYDRQWVLSQRTFVCEPESLDPSMFCDSEGSDWEGRSDQEPGVVLFVDETGSMPMFPQISVSREDLNNHLLELRDEAWADRINPAVLVVLEVLQESMKSEQTVYHCDLLTKLACQIRESELDLDDAAEAAFVEEQAMTAKNSKMQSAWLLPLLSAVSGNGQLWIDKGTLNLMQPNGRFKNVVSHPAVRQCTFFDATGDVSELEAFMGIELPVIAQRAPLEQAKVTVHQWTGLGRLGYSRQPIQERMVNALLDHLEAKDEIDRATPIIDVKRSGISKGRTRMPITWLGQSRGSNVAKEAKSMVMIGAPSQNLMSLVNRYQMLFGGDYRFDDSGVFVRKFMASNRSEGQQAGGFFAETCYEHVNGGLRDYIRRKTRADVMQGLGRVRALRRPGEEITVHYISDFVIEDLPVTVHCALRETGILSRCGITRDSVDQEVQKQLASSNRRVTCKTLAKALNARTKDIRTLAEMHAKKYEWLLNGHGKPDLSAEEIRKLEKARAKGGQEKQEATLMAAEADHLRRQFPIGCRVSSSFDPSKKGVVEGYCRHRGVPKVQVRMAGGLKVLPVTLINLEAIQDKSAA